MIFKYNLPRVGKNPREVDTHSFPHVEWGRVGTEAFGKENA